MPKFYVSYDITLSAGRCIEAESEEDALRIAEELRFDEPFFADVTDSWESDCDQWRGKYCKVEVTGQAPDDEPADNAGE